MTTRVIGCWDDERLEQLAAGTVQYMPRLQPTTILLTGVFLLACGDGSRTAPEGDGLTWIPRTLLEQPLFFSGVVVGVDAPTSPFFGNLKMASTGGARYQARVSEDSATLTLVPSQGNPYLLPIAQSDNSLIGLDFSQLASRLSVGAVIGLNDVDLKVERSELARSTRDKDSWIVDIDTWVGFTGERPRGEPLNVRVRVRWTLGPVSDYVDPDFKGRQSRDGIGFFVESSPSGEHYIRRFSDQRKLTLYVKNLPNEYRPALAEAVAQLNDVLLVARPTSGGINIDYLSPDDPRGEDIIAGDLRYWVLEWDISNRASYAGLGPSWGDSQTGEQLAAASLIQGPAQIELHRNWYQSYGRAVPAGLALRERSSLAPEIPESMAMSLGQHSWTIPAYDPRVQVPSSFDFDLPPAVSLEVFLHGNFRQVFAHELGHNLGLTHNFKGSLAADGQRPSGSVMEYVRRPQRYLHAVGPYDREALLYGYAGIEPSGTGADLSRRQKPDRSREVGFGAAFRIDRLRVASAA
jgi:hypothetical protein